MNNNTVWFPFYIGDYIKDTQELSPIEHGMYLKLMLWYYTKGKPIPHIKRYAIAGANADANAGDLLSGCSGSAASVYELCDYLLDEFFIRDGDSWRHKRIDAELEKRAAISEKRRASANKRYEKEPAKDKPKAPASAVQKQTQSQSQSQDIGEVSPNTPQGVKAYVQKPDDVSEQTWRDFVAHRKKKRADITETAMNRIRIQAEYAGWSMEDALAESIARGWAGFKAEWVQKEGENNGKSTGRGNKPTVTETAGNVFDAIQRGDI